MESSNSSVSTCKRCGGNRHYTGTRWRCSACYNAWQTANKATRTPEQRRVAQERQTATRRKWPPDQRARQNARAAAWREANRERHREMSRDWYWRNVERARAAKLAEYYANPQQFMARNLVRKARIRDQLCEHGASCVDADFLAALYAAPCTYCGDPATHADHFVPLARGGLHCQRNLVPACSPCNLSKSDRDPGEWMAGLAS